MANKLRELFHPEERLKNIRLSGNSPCIDCENVHRLTRGTAWDYEFVDEKKCKECTRKIFYDADCLRKLQWYEDNDENVKNLERKDKYRYDKGVRCPEDHSDGYPILYPDGWT